MLACGRDTGVSGHFIRGHPSMLPGASRRTSPTTNKLPPTQTTSSFAPCARAPSSASNGEPMISPRNSGLTLATRFGAMARGMSAAHHQYVAASGSKAMTAEGSLSATAPQTMWSAPPRAPAFFEVLRPSWRRRRGCGRRRAPRGDDWEALCIANGQIDRSTQRGSPTRLTALDPTTPTPFVSAREGPHRPCRGWP